MSNKKRDQYWTVKLTAGKYWVMYPNGTLFSALRRKDVAEDIRDNFNALLSATARVAELEAQLLKTEWVSVEERLPEIGQTVEAYTENLVFTKTHHKITEFTRYGFEGATSVTHWKELTPPQNTKGDD